MHWIRIGSAAALGLIASCFRESPGDAGAACPQGSKGCPCYGNSTCDEALSCEASVELCIPTDCVAGTLECTCDDGQCAAGAICEAGLCAPVTGTTSGGGEATAGSAPASSTGEASTSSTGPLEPDSDSGSSSTGGCTGAPAEVRLYGSETAWTPSDGHGDAGVRAFVDALCATAMPRDACDASVAVFSVDSMDEVRDLPTTTCLPADVPVVGPDGTVQISPTFTGMLASDVVLDNSLAVAGVEMPVLSPLFWSGSFAEGIVDEEDNCGGWSTELAGSLGNLVSTTPQWLASTTQNCDNPRGIVCACWQSG